MLLCHTAGFPSGVAELRCAAVPRAGSLLAGTFMESVLEISAANRIDSSMDRAAKLIIRLQRAAKFDNHRLNALIC